MCEWINLNALWGVISRTLISFNWKDRQSEATLKELTSTQWCSGRQEWNYEGFLCIVWTLPWWQFLAEVTWFSIFQSSQQPFPLLTLSSTPPSLPQSLSLPPHPFPPRSVLSLVLTFSTCSPLTTKAFQIHEVPFRQNLSQTYSLLSRFLIPLSTY